MIFTKETALNLVRQGMTPTERRNVNAQENAMAAALDDLAMRMRSASFLGSYTVNLSTGDRQKTLTGEANDLRHLFALAIGSGEDARVLEYEETQEFLRDHNDPNATAGKPDRFTVLGSEEGYPVVRFNCPLEEDETLTVYHYVDVTPENVSMVRSIPAVVFGTKAYFYGLESERGALLYVAFKELAALSREADTFTPAVSISLPLSRDDQSIRQTVNQIARTRR